MFKGKKIKLKKIYLHPVASYLLLSLVVIVISGILSLFNFQTTYNIVDSATMKLEQVTSSVVNLFSFDGFKYIVSNATKNFIGFAPLSMYLLASVGLAVCEASGFLDVLFKKVFARMNNKLITFLIIFIATISTLINEIGFVILIPIAAIIFKAKKRNPLAGVSAAFGGVAFGYGTSIFIGSHEVAMIPYTTTAARLIDANFHVSLSSNLYIMIVSSVILSVVGMIIIEKIIVPNLGRCRQVAEYSETNELEIIDIDETEQEILSNDYKEKRGLKWASIVGIVFILFFIYSVIPGLPFSGLLLDNSQDTYLKQIFGTNSYFQDGFAFMISLLLLLVGLVYGFGSKKFCNDKDVVRESNEAIKKYANMILLLFVASQFIAIFKKTNIGTVIAGILANVLNSFSFGGIPYLIIVVIIIMISDFFLTGVQAKWIIFSPVIVPLLMQTNIAPQFVQFVMRGIDSMTNGITPLYAYFVLFVGYLNIYSLRKGKTYTITEAIKLMLPYFIIISFTWLLLLIGWYIIGLPIGPGVYPNL